MMMPQPDDSVGEEEMPSKSKQATLATASPPEGPLVPRCNKARRQPPLGRRTRDRPRGRGEGGWKDGWNHERNWALEQAGRSDQNVHLKLVVRKWVQSTPYFEKPSRPCTAPGPGERWPLAAVRRPKETG